MRYISRSSHETFKTCPRQGYWRYLSGPFGEPEEGSSLPVNGLEESFKSWHLQLGTAWHEGAEELLQGQPWEVAWERVLSKDLLNGLEVEPQNWLLAAFIAWDLAKKEEFFERFEVLTVEEEFEIPISPNVVLYTRADAVLRERADGSNWVLNWKTASDVKDWNKKWFFDPQGWTEALAAESKLEIPIAGTIYLGVWKGPIYQGKTTSRLIYGYKHRSKAATTYGTENGGGGTRFEAWKESFPFGEGLAAWVSWLPKDFLRKHFVESAPQLRQDKLVEDWLAQVVRRENDIDYALRLPKEEQINFFEQNWGDMPCNRCAFKPLCLNQTSPEELIREGFLAPRRRSPRDEAEGRAAE